MKKFIPRRKVDADEADSFVAFMLPVSKQYDLCGDCFYGLFMLPDPEIFFAL